jgi:hypothetical protein
VTTEKHDRRTDRSAADWHMPTVDHTGLVRPVTSTKPEAVNERKRMALNHAAQGKTITQIAKDLAITRWTIHSWLKNDPNFKEQWERIKGDRDAAIAEEMEDLSLGLARGQSTKDGVPLWPAIKHWMQVTDPGRHGDKKQVEHTGTVVHSLIPRARRLDDLLSDPDIIDVPQIESGGDGDDE